MFVVFVRIQLVLLFVSKNVQKTLNELIFSEFSVPVLEPPAPSPLYQLY